MRFPGFVGPSYTATAINLDCQRCVNFYPELDELQTGKEREIAALIGRDGSRLLSTVGNGPCRGAYVTSTGTLLVASGGMIYRVSSDWTSVVLGTLNTLTGPVYMADNGAQVMIVDGTNGYIYDPSQSPSFGVIADPDFPNGAQRVTYQDGYFIVCQPGTQKFYWCDLYDGKSWDALDFASAEGSPDNLVTVISDHREVWLLGTQSTEVFYNAGDTQVFERIQGTFIEYGCASPFAVEKVDNSIIWLAVGKNGAGFVLRTNGYQVVRISNHSIEAALQTYGDLSRALAFTYTRNGHHFYLLQIPGANTTWVYDTSTGQWHEWTYTDSKLGQQKYFGFFVAFAYNTYVVGDYRNNNIYQLDPAYCTDNGAPITGLRTAPYIAEDMCRIAHDALQLDVQTGVGLDGVQLGTNPTALLSWSDDYGRSWSSDHEATLGPIGTYRTRVIWRQLGVSRARVYRLRITDPVIRRIVGAQLQVRKGRS